MKTRLLLTLTAAVLAAGCGTAATTSTAPGSSGNPSSAPSGGATAALPDPCTLLTNQEAATLLGATAPPTPFPGIPSKQAPEFNSCTWGNFGENEGVVGIMVSRPSGDAHIDYARLLASQVEAGTPVAVGTDGKQLNHGIIQGGGGVGKSIIFSQHGITVLLGAAVSADVSAADLLTIATAVAARVP